MQRESTSAKRKRGDPGSEPATVARRSAKFWFDDGSVVLQVENTQFRVHRSILASYSPVFDDLFKVPQPEGDKSDWVDGCPTVCMSGDTADDWDNVLAFMYKPSALSLEWPDVCQLEGMMRLGKKYQLDDVFEVALTRLKAQFPKTLDALDFMTSDGKTELCEWISTYFQVITRLGEEMALWSILPITYYLAVSYEENIPTFLLFHRNLSPNSMRSVTYGTSAMWEDIINRKFKWTNPTETIIPTNYCPAKNKCIAERTLLLSEVLTNVGAQDVGIALVSWAKGASYDFCAECLKAAQQACQNGRVHIWNNLGRYFFGDNWEKLEDTKSDIWPSTWQPR